MRVCVRVNGYIRRKRRKKETKEEQNISPFRRLSDYNKSGKKESKKKKFASKIIRFKSTFSLRFLFDKNYFNNYLFLT